MKRPAAIWNQIRLYCSRRASTFLHDCRHWRDADWITGSTSLFPVLRATKRFVKNKLPAIWNLPEDTPIHMELPLAGAQSLTLILHAGDRKAVLRVYPGASKQLAEAHLQGAHLLMSHGVNVPRVIYASKKPTRDNVLFILEEFIQGKAKRGMELNSRDISALATQLALMHSVHNLRWGRIWMERDEPFFPSLIQRIKRDLQELRQLEIVEELFYKQALAWAERWEPLFLAAPTFSLTHNDLQPANGIFTESGDYYLVDLNRLQWGPAAREVVRCYHRLLRLDPDLIAAFNDAYYSKLPSQQGKTIRVFCQFYEVFHRVSTLVKMNVKNEKVPEVKARNIERQRQMLDELNQLLQEDIPVW